MFHHSRSHEKKQEQAIEAAQDPNNPVSSEDAERAIVNDSKAAGSAAYQFDPNASPEEKAAQARAHLPENFHHEKKPTAMGVISDKDDGTAPKYDLPSPTTDGAIAVSKGGGSGSKHSPHPSLNEDLRWARDRTGWAPRFGSPDQEAEKDANLLDHQTFLESKLDEKFYGDWYYNAGVIIFACLATYIATILGGGLAAVFIIMASCGTYYRTSLRRVRRNFRDDVQREMAKAKLETDTESLEWINSFLVKFWPIFQPVLADAVIASVDQVLSTATPAFLDSLRLKTFTLGTKPPRLEHVKTYVKTEEDVVLMDWKFSFNPNDTADMTARQLKNKINPRVALEIRIGKGVISKGLDVLVEDFAFSGLMRVKVKLQIPSPHVEKAEICFLGRPTIDYVCKPLGGDTFGFDINFIPGLESFIQEQIHANLGPIMYDPNVFPIEIAKMLSGNAVDQAIGVVQISLHGGQGLKNPDKFPGVPDPYATVSINERDVLGKTKIVKENSNPRWNETMNIIVTSLTDNLTVQVYDWNEFRKDKLLGTVTFPLERLAAEHAHENQHLELMAGGRARGIIESDIRFFPVLEGEKAANGTVAAVPESNTGIANFTVEQARELDGSKSLIGQLNPYAVLLLNGKEIQISQKLKRTNNPIWPNAAKEVLITDRKTAKLGLVIKDDRGFAADPILGTYQIKLTDMIDLMAKGQEWYNLAGSKTGRAKMMLQWKPVGLTGAVVGALGYVTPIGVMRFHFQNARDLRNLETMGKSDPYVRVLLSGVPKGRTVTWQNNLNPDFDEIVYIPVHSARERIIVEVMDQENLGADRSLGLVEMSASEYIVQGEDGGYLVHDEKRLRSDHLKAAGKGSSKGVLNYTISFFPTIPVVEPPEEEEEELPLTNGVSRTSMDGLSRKSTELPASPTSARMSVEATRTSRSGTVSSVLPSTQDARARSGTVNSTKPTESEKQMAKELAAGEKDQSELAELNDASGPPKITIGPEDLTAYESGLIIFKILSADLAHRECYLQVLMDDYLFPSWTSSRIKSKRLRLNEIGDAIVRELDVSRITMRLMEKADEKGKEKHDHVLAKLTGQTLDVLRAGLDKKSTLTLKSEDGRESHVTVQLRYLPIKMTLDPSESINNMGTLRVEVHDATELPAADRNGFSDPYCKFILNGQHVHKTEVQKKTLQPAWNEAFDVAVKSRTAAVFKVECWDWDRGGGDDFLGAADINLNLLEPFQKQQVVLGLDGKSGSIRLNMLFKPSYVIRSRQGSSTFQGTFAVPGKVIGAPVKGVGKGAVFVGGNVIKGASFVGRGFRRRKTGEPGDSTEHAMLSTENGEPEVPSIVQPEDGDARPRQMTPPAQTGGIPAHLRSPSIGASSIGASPGSGADMGNATFAVTSAIGYEAHNLRVFVQLHTPKGRKDVHKTKATKAVGGSEVQFDEHSETFTVKCAADAQFTVAVKDAHTFGADKELGEGMLVVPDAAGGATTAKQVHAGPGVVTINASFKSFGDSASLATGADDSKSPSRSGTTRRSLFAGKRDSRQSTPVE